MWKQTHEVGAVSNSAGRQRGVHDIEFGVEDVNALNDAVQVLHTS